MQVKVTVRGVGSMGVNHLRMLKDFDEKRGLLVGIVETHEPVLKHAMSRFHVAGYAAYPTKSHSCRVQQC